MTDDRDAPTGLDLARGLPLGDIADGAMIAGHAQGKPVLVARAGDDIFALDGHCTHYGAPLADGLLVGETVHCPWHHACFSLRTGEALCAPALKPLARWEIERRDGRVFVLRAIAPSDGATAASSGASSGRASPLPASVVIVGAGGAGNAAAEMLRREGYEGTVTLIGADESIPCDRPNLSKDYLAGSAPEEWIPLRSREFYAEHEITLITGQRVTAIDTGARRVTLDDGRAVAFGALLVATGAEPIRLPAQFNAGIPLHYLRTLADSRAIIAATQAAGRVVVIGASFIGLEVAASLRARGLEVHVVAPETRPLEKVLGPELGDFIRRLHEEKGVVFHLGRSASRIDESGVTLDDGERLAADFVVAGIGVRPNVELATQSGLAVDRGIVVDEFLETSAPGVYAAGDVARYPDSRTGERIRVEHWVVAERQGQTAARNMLRAPGDSSRERYDAVPFFWSNHYETSIHYVGHAERFDEVQVAGSVKDGDCAVGFRLAGKTLAVATVGRDLASLEAEAALERGDAQALDALLGAR